jgi:hypothetical protein
MASHYVTGSSSRKNIRIISLIKWITAIICINEQKVKFKSLNYKQNRLLCTFSGDFLRDILVIILHFAWIDDSYSVFFFMRILKLFIIIFLFTNSLPKYPDFFK